MNRKIKNSQDSGYPIYIRLQVEDYDHKYGYFDLETSVDLVKQTLISITDSIEIDDTYVTKAYQEVLLHRFRPKTNFDDFSSSVIKYVCSAKNAKNIIDRLTHAKNLIIVKLDILNDNNSELSIMPTGYSKLFKREFSHNIYLGNSNVKISFDSKTRFLTEDERVVFYRLAMIVLLSPDQICRLTTKEILAKFEKYEDDYDKTFFLEENIEDILKVLSFYGFIDIQINGIGENNLYTQKITICDLEILKPIVVELFDDDDYDLYEELIAC